MIGWILKLIPADRVLAALVAAGLIAVGSGIVGWKVRDYFAERKEFKELQTKLVAAQKNAADWKSTGESLQKTVDSQNARAATLQAQRNEEAAKAAKASQDAFTFKDKLTRMEAARAEDHGMCERTAPCHWLRFNAAVNGTEAPSECSETGSVSH